MSCAASGMLVLRLTLPLMSLSPAWSDLRDISLSAAECQVAVAGTKCPALVNLNLQPPAHCSPALLAKLNAIVAPTKVPSTPVDKGKVKISINMPEAAHDMTNSELSEDEDAIMAH